MEQDVRSMSLIYKVEEQSTIGFTGKLNILDEKNHQFMGEVLFREGEIVGCHYEDYKGSQGLLYLIISDVMSEYDFYFVVEPEMVSEADRVINFDYIKERASEIVRQFHVSRKLRPSKDIRLLVQKNFIISGKNINFQEFQILCAITDCATVEELYGVVEFHEYEITNALVSLRRKGAVKVVEGRRYENAGTQ